ncbi:YisL family protein [Neobacillus sp. D3-1R]|uniref:YisL family protein n=1 Tax=Neobacillus sp. D3-1R TaxID=3445778 RepID=UPI003FA07B6B
MTHAHITSWFLALILFFIAISLHKSGKAKGFKIMQMVLRVVYLLILATGLILLFGYGMLSTDLSLQYILKAAIGIWIIGLFEMILSKLSKNQPTKVLWIQFIIAFLLALYLGFKLPLGF